MRYGKGAAAALGVAGRVDGAHRRAGAASRRRRARRPAPAPKRQRSRRPGAGQGSGGGAGDVPRAAAAAGRSRGHRARQDALRDQLPRLPRRRPARRRHGRPNLLRSQLVLNDQHGELILPVVQNGRQNPGMPPMPPLPLGRDDVKAVAEYIHSVAATMRGQGTSASRRGVELNILVGDAKAGEAYFAREVRVVPLGDRRSAGHRRSRIADPCSCRTPGSPAAAAAAAAAAGGAGVAAGHRERWRTPGRREGRGPAGSHRRLLVVVTLGETACSARSGATATCRKSRSTIRWKGIGSCCRLHRQRHARRDRLSGDPEMTFRKLVLTTSLVVAPVLLLARAPRPAQGRTGADPARPPSRARPGSARRRHRLDAAARSGGAAQAAGRFLADLFGRLHRPALQRADADQPDHRQEPHARLDRRLRRGARARRGGGFGAAAAVAAARPSSSAAKAPATSAAAARRASRAPSCRSTACSTSRRRTTSGRWTRATGASCGTTSGRRRAARTSATAARRCGTTTCSSRRRTTTSSRSTRSTGQGALARRDRRLRSSSTSRRWRRSSSATTCSSAPATTSTRRASCSRSTRKPASASGCSTRCR